MFRLATTPIALLALAACATTGAMEETQPPASQPSAECNAAPAQRHIGKRATADLGQTLLDLTGARILRWAPPRSALTMDYRMDRLTVAYDDDMIIQEISCG